MEEIKIRRAGMEDLPEIMKIIAQAVESLRVRGVDQWQDGYPNEAVIRNDIEQEISYVVSRIQDGREEVIATAAITFAPEACYEGIYEGTWRSEEPYAVVHRIAAAEAYKGHGIAGRVMEFVRECCRKRGIAWIRVDTHRDNLVMQQFLTRQGFQKRGSITLESGAHRFAFDADVQILK